MTFRDYKIEDFLAHPTFRLWVLDQDETATAFWESWLQEHPDHSGRALQAREMLLLMAASGSKASPTDEAIVWDRIERTIDAEGTTVQGGRLVQMPGTATVKKMSTRRWLVYAAVFTGVLIAAFAAFVFYPVSKKQSYTTAMGELKTVVLPDNSVVRLNVNSSIRYDKTWGEELPREIWLSGEAFFTVMHKSNNQQFIVHTNDVDIQVVGTEFNVNTRRVKTQVVLNNGSVKLKLNGNNVPAGKQTPITMQPGDMIVYSASTAELATKKVNPEEYSSWRTNVLTFHDTPIADVIKSLHDNMGVTINLQDTALSGQTFTGSIPMDNIDVFFKTLSRSFDIQIKQKEEKVYEIREQ